MGSRNEHRAAQGAQSIARLRDKGCYRELVFTLANPCSQVKSSNRDLLPQPLRRLCEALPPAVKTLSLKTAETAQIIY